MWARCLEQDRLSHLHDLTTAVRYAQHGKKEEYAQFVDKLTRMTG